MIGRLDRPEQLRPAGTQPPVHSTRARGTSIARARFNESAIAREVIPVPFWIYSQIAQLAPAAPTPLTRLADFHEAPDPPHVLRPPLAH